MRTGSAVRLHAGSVVVAVAAAAAAVAALMSGLPPQGAHAAGDGEALLGTLQPLSIAFPASVPSGGLV